ncbi:MAG: hypothetical protein AVO33_10995 [delta proteobacterium ML8_F1]|nr:MAG: hypothetical protein AVO33_10995 [delta proteobacterium ML8_F1]
MNQRQPKIVSALKHLLLMGFSFVFLFPFIWMFLGIFKTNNEIWQQPYKLLPENYPVREALEAAVNLGFENYILNSFIVGILGTLLMLVVVTLFTYALVFVRGRYSEALFYLVLGTYMLPSAVTYVPSYIILANMNLLDTLTGLILSNLPNVFAVFYLRQSFKKTSIEYIEAAKIDGASHRRILWHVVLPLNKSALYTVFVLTFVQQYNNYMWPSIMINSQEKYLISQGLRQFFIQDGAYGMNWSEVMLASTIAIVPVVIVFLLGQKWFITGITEDSGLK